MGDGWERDVILLGRSARGPLFLYSHVFTCRISTLRNAANTKPATQKIADEVQLLRRVNKAGLRITTNPHLIDGVLRDVWRQPRNFASSRHSVIRSLTPAGR